jgi:hypothetical protein
MPNDHTLNFARLLDWLEGRLSDQEAEQVAEQVAQAGEQARADLDWLRAFQQASAKTTLAAPPPETRDLLRRRFAEYAKAKQPTGVLRRLAAMLVFDSNLQPAAAGLRSAGTQASQRQLIYAAEIADIALNIQSRQYNQHFDLAGQILPKSALVPAGFSVELLRDAQPIGTATADDLGEFAFEDLPPGMYELGLRNEQFDLIIAPIELRR